jgi:hypothetical protein
MPMKPIRIGGDIEQPTLLHRVSPDYPQIAINAKKEGIVILEATVNADGLSATSVSFDPSRFWTRRRSMR